jgi:hypothetical protein
LNVHKPAYENKEKMEDITDNGSEIDTNGHVLYSQKRDHIFVSNWENTTNIYRETTGTPQ